MKDILEEILIAKRNLLTEQKKVISLEQLQANLPVDPPLRSMRKSLAESPTGIIAEFKRKSPSKGWIFPNADAKTVAPLYEENGASVLSILTDEPFFGGNMKDFKTARSLVNLPLLQKDFIIDPYQLYQSKIIGADAILLIAAALRQEECLSLAKTAHELNMEVLLEIHSRHELDYINEYVDMVGVNNRNLGSFHTDVKNSFKLAPSLPSDKLLVSESGISSPETITELRQAGFRGFLIGETFMKTGKPGHALQKMVKELSSYSPSNSPTP